MTTDPERASQTMLESRQRIDEIDRELVTLLNRRAEYARLVGAAKQVLNEPTYQPRREEVVLSHAVKTNRGPLEDAAVHRVFERILDETRHLQRVE
jgi:chorismate mutase